MLVPDGCARLDAKIESPRLSINDLSAALAGIGQQLGLEHARRTIDQWQQRWFAALAAGACELVCEGCGGVHCGGRTLLQRGSRRRKLKTSAGELCFLLKQLTCRWCRRTWSPFGKLLGLAPRQRIAEELERKLVECVLDLPYEKTSRLAGKWLGASLSARTLHRCVQKRGSRLRFTAAPACAVVVADGTKVPAGASERGTEVRFSFQLLTRRDQRGRRVVQKRIAGWSIGIGGWADALPPGIATEVIVTDREKGIPELIARQHPGVRHQFCEWHLGHTLAHLVYLDGMKAKERKPLVAELGRILWGNVRNRRAAYVRLYERLKDRPQAYTMLRDALPNVLFTEPSAERTTSVIEREMREINRRTDVGVRWSVRGVANMLRLRQAYRINPDDFERVWQPKMN